MSDTTASLRRKIDSAGDLQSVVRTMKALAASSIGQYEKSVRAWPTTIAPWSWAWARAFGKATSTGLAAVPRGQTGARCDRRRRLRLGPGTGGPVQ